MGFAVCQTLPNTLEEASKVAHSYVGADVSSSKSRKSRKKYVSDSSLGSVSDADSVATTNSSSFESESESEVRRRRRQAKGKTTKVATVVEKEKPIVHRTLHTKKTDKPMDNLTKQLKALTMHLAGNRPKW